MRRKKRGDLAPARSSIVLHLAPILSARGIKNQFSYLLKIGIATNSASKMLKGKAVQLNFRQLTNLCVHLNCTPNDLLALRQLNTLPESHALHNLQQADAKPLPSMQEWMQGKSFEEVRKLLEGDAEE